MRFVKILCVLAVALCLTASVYAETQSVKVSGDLTMRSLFRSNYDYRGSVDEAANRSSGNEADQTWFMSNAEVQIDADLTDNVQTVIRLVNQRDWDVQTKTVTSTTTLAQNGLGGYTANADEFDVIVDLAYVTLKNFVYSPLTVSVGRQDLWFGKGLIIGANQQDPTAAILANEYTSVNSFDSIKAVLDYDPWTVTGVYIKVYENVIGRDDDVDVWGGNVGYKFDSYKGEAEAYWFYKNDGSIEKWGAIKDGNTVNTIGIRGSADPIDTLTLFAEGAYQFGNYIGSRVQMNTRKRSAYAFDVGAECRYLVDRVDWKPVLGAEYVLYSGNKPEDNVAEVTGDYNGWDGMYRGKFDSAIREFVGKFYASADYPARANVVQSNADAAFTNQHQIIFRGSVTPIESLLLSANYNLFWTVEDYIDNNKKSGGMIGQEFDLQANWDYTEDVSFGILGAWFIPGEVYQNSSKIATDLVGTVKVSF